MAGYMGHKLQGYKFEFIKQCKVTKRTVHTVFPDIMWHEIWLIEQGFSEGTLPFTKEPLYSTNHTHR